MYIHQNDRLTIFFGDQTTAFAPQSLYTVGSSYALAHQLCCAPVHTSVSFDYAIALKQTHGVQGVLIPSYEYAQKYIPYSQEGDFLITHVPAIALGVATADCVPLILYDTVQHVCAVVHAGYRGAAAGIACSALQELMQVYGTQPCDVQVYSGPCARACCYQVSADFVSEFFNDPHAHAYAHMRDGHWYFDTIAYICATLRAAGVTTFMFDFAFCTIHTPTLCSYRRDGVAALRQMTWCVLHHR